MYGAISALIVPCRPVSAPIDQHQPPSALTSLIQDLLLQNNWFVVFLEASLLFWDKSVFQETACFLYVWANRPYRNDRNDCGIISCFFWKGHFTCVCTTKISVCGTSPYFRFPCIRNSFHKDLMWEALVFSKEIVLVFSKDPALMDANGTLMERWRER